MTAGSFENLPIDQPLGLCDVIGLAFRIWRRNLGLIFRVLIVPTILLSISTTVLQVCLTYGVSKNNDFAHIIGYVAAGLLAFFLYLFSLFFLTIRQLAIMRLFTGFAPDWQKANAYVSKKLPWLFGLTAISALIWGVIIGVFFRLIGLSTFLSAATGPGGAVLGMVGIFAGFFGLIVVVSLMLLFTFMGLAVLACEDTTFFGVIGQTLHWTWRYFGRVICFAFVFYIVFTVVSMPVSLPVAIASVADAFLQAKGGSASAADYKISLGVMIFVQVWEAICGLLLRPVTVLAFGLFYLDLRQRNDGLDLFLKVKKLKAQYLGVSDGV